MYQQAYGYSQGMSRPGYGSYMSTGAPGLAPGTTAPSAYTTPLIPPNFNFNAAVIHFGQTLSGDTTISTPLPSAILQQVPVARAVFVREIDPPRLAPTADDLLHTIFIANIPDDISDKWMDRIARVNILLNFSN
jgi:hypothetical protein